MTNAFEFVGKVSSFGLRGLVDLLRHPFELEGTEQIDGIELLSIDPFKFLVVPRIVACVVAMPLLTLFMDFWIG